MTSSLFPDVNVWLAMTHQRHSKHASSREWLAQQDRPLCFCRFSQIGLLRLLTTSAVMGKDVMSQRSAWTAYERWFDYESVGFLAEPAGKDFNPIFRSMSSQAQASPKLWADAYLAAFAIASHLTVVTYDRAFLRRKDDRVLIL